MALCFSQRGAGGHEGPGTRVGPTSTHGPHEGMVDLNRRLEDVLSPSGHARGCC